MRRKELKLSKREVCEYVGITKATLLRYEKGTTTPPRDIKAKLSIILSYDTILK